MLDHLSLFSLHELYERNPWRTRTSVTQFFFLVSCWYHCGSCFGTSNWAGHSWAINLLKPTVTANPGGQLLPLSHFKISEQRKPPEVPLSNLGHGIAMKMSGSHLQNLLRTGSGWDKDPIRFVQWGLPRTGKRIDCTTALDKAYTVYYTINTHLYDIYNYVHVLFVICDAVII